MRCLTDYGVGDALMRASAVEQDRFGGFVADGSKAGAQQGTSGCGKSQ
jgi:hypothetical protein